MSGWPLTRLAAAPEVLALVGAVLFRHGPGEAWQGWAKVAGDVPVWTCDHEHVTAQMAFECAEEALRLAGAVHL